MYTYIWVYYVKNDFVQDRIWGKYTMAFETLTGLGGVNSNNQLRQTLQSLLKDLILWGAFLINEIFILRLDIYTLFYILKYHRLI